MEMYTMSANLCVSTGFTPQKVYKWNSQKSYIFKKFFKVNLHMHHSFW